MRLRSSFRKFPFPVVKSGGFRNPRNPLVQTSYRLWVTESTRRFLPRVLPLLSRIQVVSARKLFETCLGRVGHSNSALAHFSRGHGEMNWIATPLLRTGWKLHSHKMVKFKYQISELSIFGNAVVGLMLGNFPPFPVPKEQSFPGDVFAWKREAFREVISPWQPTAMSVGGMHLGREKLK